MLSFLHLATSRSLYGTVCRDDWTLSEPRVQDRLSNIINVEEYVSDPRKLPSSALQQSTHYFVIKRRPRDVEGQRRYISNASIACGDVNSIDIDGNTLLAESLRKQQYPDVNIFDYVSEKTQILKPWTARKAA